MDKSLTFREACAQLGITEDNLYNKGDEKEEDLIEDNDSLWEQSDDEEQGAESGNNKGDVEVFVEKGSDSSDDEEEPLESGKEVDQDNNYILSPSNISYSSRPNTSRRLLKNVIMETPRAIFNPQSEKASFKAIICEEILRTFLMHINRKLREIQTSLHVRYSTTSFSMEKMKAGLPIILRATYYSEKNLSLSRHNFSDLEGL